MHLEEIRERQGKLAGEIKVLIVEHEKATGTSINDLRIEHSFQIARRNPIVIDIHITSKI